MVALTSNGGKSTTADDHIARWATTHLLQRLEFGKLRPKVWYPLSGHVNQDSKVAGATILNRMNMKKCTSC